MIALATLCAVSQPGLTFSSLASNEIEETSFVKKKKKKFFFLFLQIFD